MMLQPFTYLLVNFCTIIICFVASFDRRIRFDRYFGTFLLSSTIVALPFILWDIVFTDRRMAVLLVHTLCLRVHLFLLG